MRPLPLRPGRVEAWPRRFWHTERPPQHYGLEESLGGRSDLGNQGHGTALVQQQLGSIVPSGAPGLRLNAGRHPGLPQNLRTSFVTSTARKCRANGWSP